MLITSFVEDKSPLISWTGPASRYLNEDRLFRNLVGLEVGVGKATQTDAGRAVWPDGLSNQARSGLFC